MNGSLTITVVEDEPSLAEFVSFALKKWNHGAQSCSTAEEAVELLAQQPTPVLLTDLGLPGNSGLWLVQQVRQRWPEMIVIVMTANQDVGTAVECLNAGAHQYLFKPVNLQQLRRVLEGALETSRLREERTKQQQKLESTVRRQTRKIRRLFLSGINSLIRALEARDAYTSGHSQRVRSSSIALARALGFSRREVRQIGLAAALHDIGKVAIPETILNKPGPLTPDEWLAIQAHPVTGENILRPIIRNPAILSAIRGHHERLDGRGYPDGLCGEQIPVFARLIAVADNFDAITSVRPYRAAMTLSEACAIMRQASGSALEPLYVEVFLRRVIERQPEELGRNPATGYFAQVS
jgi:response regulator RpfG family c-di-GMP phosphodiesterase